MFAVFHHEDLVDDEVFLRLLLKVHLFDGNASANSDLGRGVDLSQNIDSNSLPSIGGAAFLLQRSSTRSSALVNLDILRFNPMNFH